MFRVKIFILSILIVDISCKALPQSDGDAATEAPKKPAIGLSILENSDDAIFSFVKNLLNTGHAGAQIALNRLKNETEKRKNFLDEVRSSLLPIESLG